MERPRNPKASPNTGEEKLSFCFEKKTVDTVRVRMALSLPGTYRMNYC